ncbi:MAG: hypothetical protein C0404_04315 [Verrucomicrobia bacterium]|nr:hypothetical protein [Verrucomicrobiota bacterium]
MSSFRLNCPHCQKVVDAPMELAGSTVSCPHCRGPFHLQSPATQQAQASSGLQTSVPANTLTIACPHCEKQVNLPVTLAEKTVRCPMCGGAFIAPSVDPSLIPPPPSPPVQSAEKEEIDGIHITLSEDDMKPVPEPSKDAQVQKPKSKILPFFVGFAAVLLVAGVVAAIMMTQPSGGKHKQLDKQQLFQQAVDEFPGWVGEAKLEDGSVLRMATVDTHCELAAKFNDMRELEVNMLAFLVKPVSATYSIAPATAQFIMEDGTAVTPIDQAEVLSTMRSTSPWIDYLKGPITFAPGKIGDCGLVFFLLSQDKLRLEKMTSVTIAVNGNTVTVKGAFRTSEQKKLTAGGVAEKKTK